MENGANNRASVVAGGLLRIEKIYHEPNVGGYARGREILGRFPDAGRVEVPSHWNIPELHGDAGDVGDWAKKGLGSGERALRYERNLKRGLVREFQTLLSEKMPYCKVRYAFWILTHFVGSPSFSVQLDGIERQV